PCRLEPAQRRDHPAGLDHRLYGRFQADAAGGAAAGGLAAVDAQAAHSAGQRSCRGGRLRQIGNDKGGLTAAFADFQSELIDWRGYSAAPPAAASRGCSASAFCLASRSSPVSWSTTFIDSRTLPRSSKPKSLTFTLSPSLTTSVVFCTRRGANWLIWTRPSLAPKKFTKAPKSMTLT